MQGLLFLKSEIKSLGMIWLTAAASATDAAINKKIIGSGTTALIISNDELNDTLKILKSLEDFGVLLQGVSETVKNEVKKQGGGFLTMLLGTLASKLLTDILLSKKDKGIIIARERTIRAGCGSKKVLLPTH